MSLCGVGLQKDDPSASWGVLHGEIPHAIQSSGTKMLYISSVLQFPIHTSTSGEKLVRTDFLDVEHFKIPVGLLELEHVADGVERRGP